jgi:hypothetical protein
VSKAELWPAIGACYLCGTVGQLCRSHIIPKFVGDWLRRTNVTGRFRSNNAPNKLVEDLEWRYLLCEQCEGLLSKSESDVCEHIFLPLHERKQDRFRYGLSFVRFAVSVAWRGLVVLRREGSLGRLNEIPKGVESAERSWREYLLSGRATPAPHVIHALPMDVPTNLDTRGRSPYLARFLLRMPSLGTQCRNGAGYIVVKMARLFVFGTIASGHERQEWRATQLHASGGAWGVEKYHVPGWFEGYLNRGAELLQEHSTTLSLRQKKRTNEKTLQAIKDDVDGVAESDLVRSFEADLRLFGPAAFQPPLPDDEEPPS